MKPLLQKIKTKTIRDYVVYSRRKLFLKKIKKNHYKYGEEYFFSKNYLKKHLKEVSEIKFLKQLRCSNNGIFGDIQAVRKNLIEGVSDTGVMHKQIVRNANDILEHKFDLLGSGLVNLNFPVSPAGVLGVKLKQTPIKRPEETKLTHSGYESIDWHIDFKSGYRWDPTAYYPAARDYTKCFGADIKVPWELSRSQHMPQLGLAYLLTGKENYADEILSQIIDWIKNNPFCKGPNWNCPMDVGIRVANWLVSLEMIQQYQASDELEKFKLIYASITQHMDYLWHNFEWTSKLTSNHYLADITGFLFCSIYLTEVNKRQKYLDFIKNEFELEINKQMYFDGMNAEGSLPYHRLVLEMFAYSRILASNNNLNFNASFDKQLHSSFKFTEIVLRPDDSIPQIGDNDGGVFLKWINRPLTDQAYLSSIASVSFDDLGSVELQEKNIESILFTKTKKEQIKNKKKKNEVTHFKDSGLVIVKSKNLYLSFYNGSNGQKGGGGHCHNDRNSITLMWKGEHILEDAGSGYYTAFPSVRNKFRSTESHNTVSVNNEEQNRFYDNGYLFGISEDITETRIQVSELNEKIVIEGFHNGYSRLGSGLTHHRKVVYNKKNTIEIIDTFSDQKLEKNAYFLIPASQEMVFSNDSIENNVFSILFSQHRLIRSDQADYSSSYGEVKSNYFLRVKALFESTLSTTIRLK